MDEPDQHNLIIRKPIDQAVTVPLRSKLTNNDAIMRLAHGHTNQDVFPNLTKTLLNPVQVSKRRRYSPFLNRLLLYFAQFSLSRRQ